MEKAVPMDKARSNLRQVPNLSFNEVSAKEIMQSIPTGYRIATMAEAKESYESNASFRADAERTGDFWVLEFREGKAYAVRALAYCGLLRMENRQSKDYRLVSDTAHVAYVRDPEIRISRQQEMKTEMKNAFRRNMQSLLY